MSRILAVLGILVLVASLAACVAMRQGADPFLTRSEQTLDVTFWTVDTLFNVEKASQPELDQILPGTHAKVNELRAKAPPVFTAAMHALDVYRAAKAAGQTPDQTSVTAALQAASAFGTEAKGVLDGITAAKAVKSGKILEKGGAK